MLKNTDNKYIFAQEKEETVSTDINGGRFWKVIIADDEEEIHSITRMVLSDYVFEGSGLVFISALSGEETMRIVREHPDAAIILLDVVMETDDAGLKVVKYIREELGNSLIRIILRTGQAGKAPEKEVIMGYDINDYKEKTELTAQKLYSTVTAAIRSYRDLRTIERNSRGLKSVINSSRQFFLEFATGYSVKKFSRQALWQYLSLIRFSEEKDPGALSGFAVRLEEEGFKITAGSGEFEEKTGMIVQDLLSVEEFSIFESVVGKKECIFFNDVFVSCFEIQKTETIIFYIHGCGEMNSLEKDLVRIYSSNLRVAFDNIYLNREIIETQKEMIITLGEVVETRSKETAFHVQRVADASYLLAVYSGIDVESAEMLRLASPMHDVGKIGIPDSILNKQGRLTEEEFEIIKSHTVIGYDILKNSKREIMRMASIAALQHHEKWDGKGYPRMLAGEEIHIYGRITAVADVFDALTHKRIYKDAWNIDDVVELFHKEKGKHFDPNLVDILFEHLDEFLSINEKYPDET